MKISDRIIQVYSKALEIENLRNTLLRQGNDIDLNLYHVYKSKKLNYDNYINSLTNIKK